MTKTYQLNGLRILNTRPKPQNHRLTKAINDASGLAVELPTIEIIPTNPLWLNDLPLLTTVDKAIFTSANAVLHCFKTLETACLHWPDTITVFAIGKATAYALSTVGINVIQIPEVADSEHLLILDGLKQVKHQTILLIKGRGGRTLIAETLTSNGAKIHSIDTYERTLPKKYQETARSLWRTDAVDIILLTSQDSMQNLFTLFGQEAKSWILNKPCLVISSRLATIAKDAGIKTILTCHYNDILKTLEGFSK